VDIVYRRGDLSKFKFDCLHFVMYLGSLSGFISKKCKEEREVFCECMKGTGGTVSP
jgi:hypothetical protein